MSNNLLYLSSDDDELKLKKSIASFFQLSPHTQGIPLSNASKKEFSFESD